LAGTNDNTYTGPTVVNQGTLRLAKTHDINAVPAALVIGDGNGGANADVVQLIASNQIEDTAPVIINSSGLLDLQLNADAIGSLAGSGNVNVGFSVLTVGGDNTSTNFSGVISGGGGLTKIGSGTQTLSGTNTYTGSTLIEG